MLQNIKHFYSHKLGALDGEIGHIKDFYFDDHTWAVRYLVIDTGSWLSGREVLLSPHAFGIWDRAGKTLHVDLNKKQIENSPSRDSHQPVSRQYEAEFYRYYGWPAYWEGADIWGGGIYPMVVPLTTNLPEKQPKYKHRADKHLNSTHAVTGYQIQTKDGSIGHVTGLLVDDQQWVIHELVVETGHWFSGKEILVSTAQVERISYEESSVVVKLTKNDIQQTAEHEVAHHSSTGHGRN